MDSVVALLKERVSGYVSAKNGYNGLVEDVLANWEYIWNEAIVYNVLATIVYTNEPKKDFDWYDGLKLLHLIDLQHGSSGVMRDSASRQTAANPRGQERREVVPMGPQPPLTASGSCRQRGVQRGHAPLAR